MRSAWWLPWLLLLGGCGLVLDVQPPTDAGSGDFDAQAGDAGSADGGVGDASDDGATLDASACDLPDGTGCGSETERRICMDGECVVSYCGDGYVDAELGETCELEDPQCADCGLQTCACPDVVVPCADAACSGEQCVFIPQPDGTPCRTIDDIAGTCSEGGCLSAGCGDGIVSSVEECDDGNRETNDGCEPDCTLTCVEAADCSDGNACNGVELCVTSTNADTGDVVQVCGDAATLPPVRECEACDPDLGAYFPDADGDGFAADVGQSCPSTLLDCDDGDPTTFPGAQDRCDQKDNDCDGSVDEGATFFACGHDQDGDGWAGGGTLQEADGCDSCPLGMAPIRVDAAGTIVVDCFDLDARVFPGQTTFFDSPYCTLGTVGCVAPFDYNCDGLEELEESRVASCELLSLRGCGGSGWDDGVPSCGQSGSYATCVGLLTLCSADLEPRTQACR